MYYNDECKEKYFSTLARSDQRNRARKMFKAASNREVEAQRDLGLWGHDDVVWLMNQLVTIDLVTFKTQILDVYAYQQWYLKEAGLDHSDAIENRVVACNQKKITREDIDFTQAVQINLTPNFAEVTNLLSSVISLDEGVLTPPLLCFAWMNVDIKQALHVPYDGIKWSSNIILSEDGNVLVDSIPVEVCDVLRRYENTWIGRNGRKTVYPYHTGYFLKPFLPKGYDAPHEAIQVSTATSSISRVNQKVKQLKVSHFDLTYANVQKSAQFKMMLDREPTSFLTLEGRQFVEELFGNEQKDFQKSRIYDVLYIYEQYKKVFNLI